jgi:CRP/FNR family cyclic AMP-dependent transcriptional regulator
VVEGTLSLSHEAMVELLDEVSLLSALNEDEIGALAHQAQVVQWEAGTRVFEEGDAGDECYVIHRGRVKVTRRLPDGQPITLAQLGRGGVVGELALFAGERRTASLETLEPTTALAIASADLMTVLRGNAEVAIAMVGQVTQMLRDANDRLFQATTSTTNGRLLAALLSQVEARQARTPGVEEDIELVGTPTDLARLAGATKEDATRVLHWLENEGVITLRRGRIVVHSPAALRRNLR